MSEAVLRRPILVGSNVVVSEQGKMLLGKRADTGKWEFPGGKIEDELAIEGAKREMLEETGISLLDEPILLSIEDTWEEIGKSGKPWYVCVMFLWTKWSGEPQLLEGKHTEWRWFSWDDLPAHELMTIATRKLIQRPSKNSLLYW